MYRNRNRNLTLVLALAAGFVGGFTSRYFTLPSVHAETQPPNAVEIRAQHFTFVDSQGRAIATFTRAMSKERALRDTSPRIALVDPEGRELWSSGFTGFKPLAENSR